MSPPAHKALPLLLPITTASTAGSSRQLVSAAVRARTISSDSELRALGRSRVMMPLLLARRVWTYSLMAGR